jgi:hypothetical protein
LKELLLNKKEFKDNFLAPALKLGEEKCQLLCEDGVLQISINKLPEVLFMNSMTPVECDFDGVLSFRSLQKLDRLVGFVTTETIRLKIKDNYVTCDTGNFVYKMILDNVSEFKAFDISKLNNIPMPYSFEILADEYRQLKILSRLADDDYKIYFTGNDQKLVAMLSDKNKSYSSDLTLNLSAITTLNQDIILKNTFLDIISLTKDTDLSCKTDGKKVLVVDHGSKKYVFSLILK